jgi:hypothetical protein
MSKKIVIELNRKSIQNAIYQLNSIKKRLPTMVKAFIIEVAKWIVKKADRYIDRADLGSKVKSALHKGWAFEQTQNGIKILNKTNVEREVDGKTQTVPLAIIVEFGSGIVGKSEAHPNASAEGYEYNVPSRAKFLGGYWSFEQTMDNLDLPLANVDFEESENGLVFLTQGAKGVWYAYNAIVDAQTELAKSGGGEIGKMWEDIKERYIR